MDRISGCPAGGLKEMNVFLLEMDGISNKWTGNPTNGPNIQQMDQISNKWTKYPTNGPNIQQIDMK